jgi:hypothetical protein
MHVGKEYNIIMYASDNFFMHVTNMQLCMDIFAMYASDTRFYAWINVCHASKFTIFFLSMDKCLSSFMEKCLPCDKDAYSILGH